VWCSVRRDFGDRCAGGGFVDDGLFGGERGHQGLQRKVVHRARIAAAGLVGQRDRVVGEQGVVAPGQLVVAQVVLLTELLKLPDELARVDALLDDPAFFAPFAPFFDLRVGRPPTPMETYLRLMFLKFRYRLGYESLCRDRVGRCGAASDDVDEAVHPVR
jgi:transposase, IS5 family